MSPKIYCIYSHGFLLIKILKSRRSWVRIPLKIFQASSFQLLKLEIYCDDHSSLSSTTAVQYAFHNYIQYFTIKILLFVYKLWYNKGYKNYTFFYYTSALIRPGFHK